MGLFKKINKGLKKTRDSMAGAIDSVLRGHKEIDDDFFDAGFDVADVSHDGLLPRCLSVCLLQSAPTVNGG